MHKTWGKLEQIREILGDTATLEEICQGLSKDELNEALEYIDRMHDLDIYNEEE